MLHVPQWFSPRRLDTGSSSLPCSHVPFQSPQAPPPLEARCCHGAHVTVVVVVVVVVVVAVVVVVLVVVVLIVVAVVVVSVLHW